MMSYFPVDSLVTSYIEQLLPGALAYVTRHDAWMVRAQIGGDDVLISLTGERGPTICNLSAYGGDSILVAPEWRIEAGPPPYHNGAHQRRRGHAFRSWKGSGFFAGWADQEHAQPLAFDSSGKQVEFGTIEPVVAFPCWRIVVGPVDAPIAIAEFGADALE